MNTPRTVIADLIIPGLGYVLVARTRLGVLSATLAIAPLLIFSLTRWILVPQWFYALLATILSVRAWSMIHSARIAYANRDGDLPTVKRGTAFVFVLAVVSVASGLIGTRGVSLGYEMYSMPSISMSPTLVPGDYILVDTWSYSGNNPEIGDLVAFVPPDGRNIKYIKRIIGVPGDTIEMRNNTVYRNGQLADEPYTDLSGKASPRYQNLDEFTIGAGEYFLLGDYRNKSRDSRVYGLVPLENIEGRVAHLFFSSTRAFPIVFQQLAPNNAFH